MTDRKFKRTDKEKYSLSEKEELGKLRVKYKEEYDKKVETLVEEEKLLLPRLEKLCMIGSST